MMIRNIGSRSELIYIKLMKWKGLKIQMIVSFGRNVASFAQYNKKTFWINSVFLSEEVCELYLLAFIFY